MITRIKKVKYLDYSHFSLPFKFLLCPLLFVLCTETISDHNTTLYPLNNSRIVQYDYGIGGQSRNCPDSYIAQKTHTHTHTHTHTPTPNLLNIQPSLKFNPFPNKPCFYVSAVQAF